MVATFQVSIVDPGVYGPGAQRTPVYSNLVFQINWPVTVPLSSVVVPANMLITGTSAFDGSTRPYKSDAYTAPTGGTNVGDLTIELFNLTTLEVLATANNNAICLVAGSPTVSFGTPKIPVAQGDVLTIRVTNNSTLPAWVNQAGMYELVPGTFVSFDDNCSGCPKGTWVLQGDRAADGANQPTMSTTASYTGGKIQDSASLSGTISNAGGTITFSLYGPDTDCSGPPIYSEVVSVSGDGTYSTVIGYTPLASGEYIWVARYSGDSNNLPVITSCADTDEAVTVTVAPTTSPFVTLIGAT